MPAGGGMNAAADKNWATRVTAVLPSLVGVLVFAGFILANLLSDTEYGPPLRAHLISWWWVYVVPLLVAIAIMVLAWRYFRASELGRALLLTCFVVPAMIVVLNTVGLLPDHWQKAILRNLFVLIAAALPAVMYYLFIATKRASLFNEYLINLARLRLIPMVVHGAGAADNGPPVTVSRSQLDSYLLRFEDRYGPIEKNYREAVISEIIGHGVARDDDDRAGDSIGRKLTSFEATNLLTPRIVLPLGLATVLIALGWLLILPPWKGAIRAPAETADGWVLDPTVTPITVAFLGAYFFSLQMLFRRYVRHDLQPAAYLAVCQRIVLTVIATWLLVMILGGVSGEGLQSVLSSILGQGEATSDAAGEGPDNETLLLVLAFIIGIFPKVLWDVLIVVLAKLTLVDRHIRRMQPDLPLGELDGLSQWHESRLEEEDIDSAPNMATADVVEMMLNTRFAPGRVIDWVDQAILYTALGPEPSGAGAETARKRLRRHGIRTASTLVAAYNAAQGGTCAKAAGGKADDADAAGQNDSLGPLLKLLNGDGRSPMQTLVDTIHTNPNLALVLAWQKSGQRVG